MLNSMTGFLTVMEFKKMFDLFVYVAISTVDLELWNGNPPNFTSGQHQAIENNMLKIRIHQADLAAKDLAEDTFECLQWSYFT